MASTNPFEDDGPPVSQSKSSPRSPSLNPFDDDQLPGARTSSTNPFEDDAKDTVDAELTSKISTNPFEEEDTRTGNKSPTLNQKGERRKNQSGLRRENGGSKNPFDDDEETCRSEQTSLRKNTTTQQTSNGPSNSSSPTNRGTPSNEASPQNPFDSDDDSVTRYKEKASSNPVRGASARPDSSTNGAIKSPVTKSLITSKNTSKAQTRNSQSRAPSDASKMPNTPLASASISVTKVLARLLSISTNRSCADCRSPLVDSSQVYASFSTTLAMPPERELSNDPLGSFHDHHENFAPPSETPSKPAVAPIAKPSPSIDPAVAVYMYTGGHGVFLCSSCGVAHNRALSSDVATIRRVQGAATSWTTDQVDYMQRAGGNARARNVYEAYIPESWEQRRPKSNSTMSERELFCRAKYEAMAFVTPLGGPLADQAWLRILENNKDVDQWDDSEEFHSFHRLSIDPTMSSAPQHSMTGLELPSRLVDFFCVIGHREQLAPEMKASLSKLTTPEKVPLDTSVIDCYPTPNSHIGMEFPEHISKFVFPDGCCPKQTRMAPTIFNFVLTSSTGTRLYGAALHIYDESMETEKLVEMAKDSGLSGILPSWKNSSDIVFLPKCLVVISHFGFFNLWRNFLLQLYRISLVEAPLPIERYISNFVSEVPLPPQGQIKVNFGVTNDMVMAIKRPAVNELPLADFSFLPLFSALSVENIMVVMGCLMQELQVALVCQQHAMLVPVAEALISFLFPFEWQGIYIPVMPYSMLDILDAPIPFLVGLHSRYMTEMPSNRRPRGVVFVDLDNDIVHLGFDPETSSPRQPPALPGKDASKLKAKLQKYGSVVYMSAVTGTSSVRARMTKGGEPLPDNSQRPSYARTSALYDPAPVTARRIALAKTEKAYDDLSTPISGFTTEHGHLVSRGDSTREVTKSRNMKSLFRSKKSSASSPAGSGTTSTTTLSLVDGPEPDGFSTTEIRDAWLRFFVSIFFSYEKFIEQDESHHGKFCQEDFIDDLLYYSPGSSETRQFMEHFTSSQMFQRFVEEKVANPDDPFVRIFDESILAKANRSKVTTLKTGGKKETPFLDNQSGKIRETFTPAAPSNWGLPDRDEKYSYGFFPKLQPELFGKVRSPKQWPQENTRVKLQKTSYLSKQQEILTKAFKPLAPPVSSIAKKAKKVTKDVEWAIVSLSCSINSSRQIVMSPSSRRPRPSSKKSVDTNSSRSAPDTDVRGAEELVISARRKQGVLIGVTIKVQALCRMHLAKMHYRRLKKAIICLQRQYRSRVAAPAGEEEETVEPEIVISRRAAVKIQRVIRGSLSRRKARVMMRSILLIQTWSRGVLVRRQVIRLHEAAIRVQSVQRGRRVRFAYALVKNLICKAQARLRGHLTRKWVQALVNERMSLYRPHLVDLWYRAYSPLAFRTKFWSVAKKEGFLHINLLQEELERLWEKLGVAFSAADNVCEEVSTRKLSCKVDNGTFARYLKVQGILSADDSHHGGDSSVLLPSQVGEDLKDSADRLQREKLQVYEKLNACKDKNRLTIYYSEFGISVNEKGKKARFIEDVWRCYEYADKSAFVMLSLFPELKSSKDIHCDIHPSKKGQRRVSHSGSVQLEPLEEKLDTQLRLDTRIKQNMREFAAARFRNTRSRSSREKMFLEERFSRQRNAAMQARGSTSWTVCRHAIIVDLLYPSNG